MADASVPWRQAAVQLSLTVGYLVPLSALSAWLWTVPPPHLFLLPATWILLPWLLAGVRHRWWALAAAALTTLPALVGMSMGPDMVVWSYVTWWVGGVCACLAFVLVTHLGPAPGGAARRGSAYP